MLWKSPQGDTRLPPAKGEGRLKHARRLVRRRCSRADGHSSHAWHGILAIANRLGANQALGDIVERVARKRREIDWAWKYYISLYHRNMRFLTIKEMFTST